MESSLIDVESGSPPRDLLQAIGLALEELTSHNKEYYSQSPDELTVFHALSIPKFGLRDYVLRIGMYANCSPECFVVAVVLLNRLLAYSPHIKLSLFTAHRLVATAVVLAVKSIDDCYFRNSYYAGLCGVSTRELNRLEGAFLSALQYDLHVPAAEFQRYHDRLMWYVVDAALQPEAHVAQHVAPLAMVDNSWPPSPSCGGAADGHAVCLPADSSPPSPVDPSSTAAAVAAAVVATVDKDDDATVDLPTPNNDWAWSHDVAPTCGAHTNSPSPQSAYVQYIVVSM